MNIFYLDEDPQKAAQFHNDIHCSKMILETAQLLCSVRHLNSDPTEISYKLCHKNHPCTKWAAHSKENYTWLTELGVELFLEKVYRTDKGHASIKVIKECVAALDNIVFPASGFTKPALAMPEQYVENCPITSYRNYYLNEKIYNKNGKNIDNWTKRGKPYWWNK